MKKRWLLNLILLLVVGGIAAFVVLHPKPVDTGPKTYVVSTLAATGFTRISIEFPTKKPVQFERVDGNWRLVLPYKARASREVVAQIAGIVAASSHEKFPASNAAQYGLDNPALKVKLDDQEFAFGMYNPLTSEQYVQYKDAIYLVNGVYSEAASTQTVELLDKHPLAPGEYIAGFDLGHLEQWETSALNLDFVEGKWKVSSAKAKPDQNVLNQWLMEGWRSLTALAVEPYRPDGKPHPSFEVKLKSGKKIHFDKLQESPELLLARPDEGMMYHFPQEVGFNILNPPVGFKE